MNAVKPLKQTRNGNINQALAGLGSSTFRRIGRLVLPTTAATILSWIICLLGGYEIGRACEATWIRDTSPDSPLGFVNAIRSLVRNCFTTWSSGKNIYDPIQWTLPFLLQGSMFTYLALLGTLRCQSRYRLMILMCLYAFSWAKKDGA